MADTLEKQDGVTEESGKPARKGRGQKGRFAKGNKIQCRTGRLAREVERGRYEALLRGIEPGLLADAARMVLKKACDGDVPAFTAIVKMLLGTRSIYEIQRDFEAEDAARIGGLAFGGGEGKIQIVIEHGTTVSDVRRAMGLALHQPVVDESVAQVEEPKEES